MSLIEPPLTTEPSSAAPAAPRPARRGGPAWGRVALACALLAGGATARLWQERRIAAELRRGYDVPFPLADLPMDLGDWRVLDDRELKLEPEVARLTGASDHIMRHYVHLPTGLAADVIVLYGPAALVFPHVPPICYPSAGYAPAAGPVVRSVPLDDRRPAALEEAIYAKGVFGMRPVRVKSYYSWGFEGHWTPDVGTYAQVERRPAMFKVQLSRLASDGERLEAKDPCEALFAALAREIDRRVPAPAGR